MPEGMVGVHVKGKHRGKSDKGRAEIAKNGFEELVSNAKADISVSERRLMEPVNEAAEDIEDSEQAKEWPMGKANQDVLATKKAFEEVMRQAREALIQAQEESKLPGEDAKAIGKDETSTKLDVLRHEFEELKKDLQAERAKTRQDIDPSTEDIKSSRIGQAEEAKLPETIESGAIEAQIIIDEYREKIALALEAERDRLKRLAEQESKRIVVGATRKSEAIIDAARKEAEQIVLVTKTKADEEAQKQAAQIVREAEGVAEKIFIEKTHEIKQIAAEAKEKSEKILADAREAASSESDRIRAKAIEEAEQLTKAAQAKAFAFAQEESTKIINQARQKAQLIARATQRMKNIIEETETEMEGEFGRLAQSVTEGESEPGLVSPIVKAETCLYHGSEQHAPIPSRDEKVKTVDRLAKVETDLEAAKSSRTVGVLWVCGGLIFLFTFIFGGIIKGYLTDARAAPVVYWLGYTIAVGVSFVSLMIPVRKILADFLQIAGADQDPETMDCQYKMAWVLRAMRRSLSWRAGLHVTNSQSPNHSMARSARSLLDFNTGT